MTTVLTIPALDLGISRTVNYMARVCNGWAVAEGRTQVPVPTSGWLDPSAGDNLLGPISKAADALDRLLHAVPGPKVVFGYSQGAQIAGTWLRRHAEDVTAPNPGELSFLLIGNPERRYGKQPWTRKITPDNTRYRVRDVTRRLDNWSDYDPAVHSRNQLLAMFGSVHTNYWKTDPYGSQAEVVRRVGNTEYVITP